MFPCRFLLRGCGMLFAAAALAQNPARFQFQLPPAGTVSGLPTEVRIIALRDDGSVATHFTQTVRLRAQTRRPADPIATEIARDGEWFEFTNPSDQALDLSGWLIELRPWSGYPGTVRRLPMGAVLPPRGLFTWSSRTSADSPWPHLGSAAALKPRDGLVSLQLWDPGQHLREQVWFANYFTGYSSLRWGGPGLWLTGNPLASIQRSGTANHFQADDWSTNLPPTFGELNPGLRLPWTGSHDTVGLELGVATFTNGTWAGTVTVQDGGSPLSLALEIPDGVVFESEPFAHRPLPEMAVTLVAGSWFAREASHGPAATLRLALAADAITNTVVTVVSAAPGEFSSSPQLTIPAGARATELTVTNHDDTLADGRAIVTFRFEVAGHRPAEATFSNEDDEAGALQLQLPLTAREGEGPLPAGGVVFLPLAASHDTEVELQAELPLLVPRRVIIPAGRMSAPFPIEAGEDDWVNTPARTARVLASLPGWATAEAAMTVTDNEDRSVVYELPAAVVEGDVAEGRLKLAVARDYPARVVFSERLVSSLRWPDSLSIPPGITEMTFPLRIPNDAVAQEHGQTELTVRVEDATTYRSAPVRLLDDEVDITRIHPWLGPAAFSGDLTFIDLKLTSSQGTPQRTNLAGHIRIVKPEQASVDPEYSTLAFSNGVFAGPIRLLGTGLDAEIEIAAAGLTNRVAPWDIFPGHRLSGPVLDLARNRQRDTLLLTMTRTNVPGLLVELDPGSGTILRELALPRPANSVAVSDDGSVAWLASESETLQRVDLRTWRFDREFPLATGGNDFQAVGLGLFPGSTNRLLVLVRPTRGMSNGELKVYEDGVARPGGAEANAGTSGNTVIPGRTPEEMFVQAYWELQRVLLQPDGLKVVRSQGWGYGPDSQNVVLSGDRIYHPSGTLLDADSLTPAGTWSPVDWQSRNVVMPFPEFGLAASAVGGGAFQTYSIPEGALVGEHALPQPQHTFAQPFARIMRWGQSGLAARLRDGSELWLWESPLLSGLTADLGLTLRAPADPVVLPVANGIPLDGRVTWEFTVTNRGPGTAHATQLKLQSGDVWSLGSLLPNASATLAVERGKYGVGYLRELATVSSDTRDLTSSDNTLLAETAFVRPLFGGARQLMLAATDLAVSPADDRLLATVSRMPGNQPGGVAIIDPRDGRVERVLPVGTDPQRLALTADGKACWVQLGTNRLVRWNWAADQLDAELTLTNEPVLDFEPLADGSGRLALSTPRRLLLATDSVLTTKLGLPDTEYRNLAQSDGTLWMATATELRGYRIHAAGLALRLTRDFNFLNSHLDFTADQRHLHFPGVTYDLAMDNFLLGLNGDFFLPSPRRGLLYSAASAYDLESLHHLGDEFPGHVFGGESIPEKLVAWGQDGLASRDHSGRIQIWETALVAGAAADLGLVSRISEPPVPGQAFAWELTVTNHSSVAAHRVLLSLAAGPFFQEQQVVYPGAENIGGTFFLNLGPLPGHAAASVRMTGIPNHWRLELTATVQANLSDPNPDNNTLRQELPVAFPQSDLALLSVTAPAQVSQGAEFDATFVLTNRGPASVADATVMLARNAGLEFVGTQPGRPLPDCCGDAQSLGSLGPINVGETLAVTVRFRANEPGLYEVAGSAGGSTEDLLAANNHAGQPVFVRATAPPSVLEERRMPKAHFAWNEADQMLLATWADKLGHLTLPTLAPTNCWTLPGSAGPVAPILGGQSAWVAIDGSRLARVSLSNGTIDRQFAVRQNLYPPFGAFVAIPGAAGLVAAVGVTESGGGFLTVYDEGVARPREAGPFPWNGAGYYLGVTPTGTLLLSGGGELREFKVMATGIEALSFRGPFGSFAWGPVSFAGEFLFSGSESALRRDSPELVPLGLPPSVAVAADPVTGSLFHATPARGIWDGPPLVIRRLRLPDLREDWHFEQALPSSDVSDIVPLGRHGALIVGDKLRYLRADQMQDPATDLGLTATFSEPVLGTNQLLSVRLQITNRAPWQPLNPRLLVELSAGVTGEGPEILDLPGRFTGTNVTLFFRTTAAGPQTLRFLLISDTFEITPQDGVAEITFVTPPPPRLLLGDSLRRESQFNPVVATLTTPAPADMEVVFDLRAPSFRPEELATSRAVFHFARGTLHASVDLLNDDAVPEADKSFALIFASGPVEPLQREVTFTVLDDDFATLVLHPLSVTEGNAGTTTANVAIHLPYGTEVPIEVGYTLSAGTATAGEDFLARSGRLRFGPDRLTNFVEVPIVGDIRFEPTETVVVSLNDGLLSRADTQQVTVQIRNDDAAPPPLLRLTQEANGQSRLTYDSLAGMSYRLLTRTNQSLDIWQPLGGSVLGDGSEQSFLAPANNNRLRLYRVLAQ